ncbi:hypothetical protein chiPu_0023644, partial [Chiloscyllium punctatum]|nr:hypothetical protein [Chiloscyllium punctatum]
RMIDSRGGETVHGRSSSGCPPEERLRPGLCDAGIRSLMKSPENANGPGKEGGEPGLAKSSGPHRPIPQLIVTQDESLLLGPNSGAERAADDPPDEECRSSDSGCGGSPAPSLLLRKLSGSSLSSAGHSSSFEESEDDFSPSSDAETQQQRLGLGLEDGLGVSDRGLSGEKVVPQLMGPAEPLQHPTRYTPIPLQSSPQSLFLATLSL